MPRVELDRLDHQILSALQENNQVTADTLSELVGLSPSAIQRRIKRMRKEKVIVSDVSVVNPKLIGQKASFVVEVNLEHDNAQVVSQFKRRMLASPEVQQCYYVTGNSDFVLIVTASDIDDYEEITQRLFFHENHVRKFTTSVVLARVKTTLAVPIND